MTHGFPTAPLASGLKGAGGTVENPAPLVFTRSGSTYRPGNSVQTSGATSNARFSSVCQALPLELQRPFCLQFGAYLLHS